MKRGDAYNDVFDRAEAAGLRLGLDVIAREDPKGSVVGAERWQLEAVHAQERWTVALGGWAQQIDKAATQLAAVLAHNIDPDIRDAFTTAA